MQMLLQFGYGMMTHCKELIKEWGNGTVILSPRDLTSEQMVQLSKDLKKVGGGVCLDPQFYDPRADHPRLTDHDFWPESYETSSFLDRGIDQLLIDLKSINTSTNTDFYILPGLFYQFGKDEWFIAQDAIIKKGVRVLNDKETFATIALSSDVVRDESKLEQILSSAETWPVDGYYVVPEHPSSQYLVEDPIWLSNLLAFLAGLKLLEKKVILGYANHQMLAAGLANVDAIASGTWLNVRSFSAKKFSQAEEGTTSRRATWYYCPHSYSEYKIPFLDIAHRSGILDQLKPINGMANDFCSPLFTGAIPSSVAYTESKSFRHYLDTLRKQSLTAKLASFDDTVNAYNMRLDSASDFISTFHRHGVRGQDRDFAPFIDINRAAISQLIRSRGLALSMSWN
ncbi:hypothetical protein FO488_02255 [Geobacter sp. FeAm09]|uniref:hypothetical protein n=1 Tax=Geobacter sp. FeAm09 TaxID=2597769 RepID=UPI0011ECD712|nr:hypothetical protein [Geobacter sp. FeAm09]QEM67097.1 hypothetical protein FO488_02255 [Geobacter sp. FeAm09]